MPCTPDLRSGSPPHRITFRPVAWRRVSRHRCRDPFGAGRAILAQFSEADALARLGAMKRKAMTAHTVTDLPGLRRALAEVRRLGYALNDQEAFIGDISVAAPLADRAGKVVGAINIAVPSPRWKLDDVHRKLAPQVLGTARDIAGEMGVL